MQRFMLPVDEIARTATTRSGAPKLTGEALKRQNMINEAYKQTCSYISYYVSKSVKSNTKS